MARIDNKLLFFTTSPRTPIKMIPEIQLLHEKFSGLSWDKSTQEQFIDELAQSDFFEGKGSPADKAFSARDRINRAPKALGFIDLKPYIELTEAGNAFIYGKRPQEIFLRQLLKFQLPSPYHLESKNIVGTFCIRPYLEIFRLVRELEYITFDEFKIFAVQMTDYHKFNIIRDSILHFRENKEQNRGQYKRFVNNVWENAILEIHSDRIAAGKTRTRETNDASLKKFIATQKSNMRDYADACFRYLRYTGLISISHKSRSISVFEDKIVELDFILSTVPRDPVFIDDVDAYKAHLFSASSPVLYTDDRDNIVDVLMRIGSFTRRELADKNLDELKDLRDEIVKQHKDAVIHEQVAEIKSYALYSEIIDTFNEIISDEYYDAPLMFEYNTWRAMTMLDGGNIKGNFNFDDAGQPLSTAAGNMPDIECDYDEFSLSVEVTLQAGQRQYESEGEPVARHYGQLKKKTKKDTYCLFIAPTINPATLAHFYGLNHLSIALYGGKSKIIPLDLDQFMRLIENSYNYENQPVPNDIRRFLDYAIKLCEKATDENHWRCGIQACVDMWLAS
ncbi:AlwI family type II restriction endonuclease [Oscillibacter sp.]|uniref:AlwI family type II restriction endonuclease n=1 Tax=Oscillibacter sp. TaxID=1945593 RepID=UPI00289B5317|nr:AlwI family type II restriction endonuclease [Oscillibacter sp.]